MSTRMRHNRLKPSFDESCSMILPRDLCLLKYWTTPGLKGLLGVASRLQQSRLALRSFHAIPAMVGSRSGVLCYAAKESWGNCTGKKGFVMRDFPEH